MKVKHCENEAKMVSHLPSVCLAVTLGSFYVIWHMHSI
jgi:hypothetical protein